MKYFTLHECTRSAVAEKEDIDNTPFQENKVQIIESVEKLLDPLRKVWENGTDSQIYHCNYRWR